MHEAFDTAAIGRLAPPDLFDLSGRVALVTGAAGGIGRWLAAGLGSAGAAVLLTDLPDSDVDAVESTLRAAGIRCASEPVDLALPDAPARLIDAAARLGEGPHVLVNCAAVNRRMPLLDVDPLTYDHIMATDLRTPFFLSQAVASRMAELGGGSIVNISSINAAMALETVTVYGPAKAALSQLTKVMAVEWAHLGIRANAIGPGFIRTPLVEPLLDDPERGAWVRSRTPMRRAGEPRELVGACLLLASDAGSYLTGQTLYVEGGMLSGSRWTTED